MKFRKRILPIILAAGIVVAGFSGCSDRGEESSLEDSSSQSSSSQESSSTSGETIGATTPNFSEIVNEMKEQNDDTVGWLYIPDLEIEDVVVCNTEDNKYYYRLNFNKEEEFNGVFWADRRSVFGDGSREQLGVNTCIYGHAMTDNPESKRYTVKFGPLHDFRDPELAKNLPYIYFSTGKEALAYEVMAVFVVNTDNRAIPYNFEPEDPKEFVKMVKEEILPRSIYDYNVDLKDTDKFIALSTCIYTLDDGTDTNYPDTYLRYVIMGRLVEPDAPRKEKAEFTINEDVLLDKDGIMDSSK